ncbi:hypothetical protein Tco_0474468 [Tanacetum coccineum]
MLNPGKARQLSATLQRGRPHSKEPHSTQVSTDSEYFKGQRSLLMQALREWGSIDESSYCSSEWKGTHAMMKMWMRNRSCVMKPGPSYDADVLSEGTGSWITIRCCLDHHEEHEKNDETTPVSVVQNNASMVPNDAYVMIDNDVHESDVLSVSHTPRNTIVNNLLNAELATYRNKLNLYERKLPV